MATLTLALIGLVLIAEVWIFGKGITTLLAQILKAEQSHHETFAERLPTGSQLVSGSGRTLLKSRLADRLAKH